MHPGISKRHFPMLGKRPLFRKEAEKSYRPRADNRRNKLTDLYRTLDTRIPAEMKRNLAVSCEREAFLSHRVGDQQQPPPIPDAVAHPTDT